MLVYTHIYTWRTHREKKAKLKHQFTDNFLLNFLFLHKIINSKWQKPNELIMINKSKICKMQTPNLINTCNIHICLNQLFSIGGIISPTGI